jgi:hypothetical protein
VTASLRYSPAVILCCVLLAGCAPSKDTGSAEGDAEAVLAFAESLEADSLLDQATAQYAIIAEQFPTADVYPLAVRRVAFLYAHPDNPAHNDTLALRWMRIYNPLARTREERQEVAVVTTLIQQNMTLREQLSRESASGDSLATLLRRQGRRVRDLEAELQQVNDELRKLKDVDVRTSRKRKK